MGAIIQVRDMRHRMILLYTECPYYGRPSYLLRRRSAATAEPRSDVLRGGERTIGRLAGSPKPMMSHDDAVLAASTLEEHFSRFAHVFGKAEAQRHALNYLGGLMVCPGRKSIEPIAMSVGEGQT